MISDISNEEMLTRLRDSEAWQQIERTALAKREAERAAAVEELTRIAQKLAKERPAHERASTEAEKAVADATAKLVAAQQAAATARASLFSLLNGTATATARAESVLRRHAPAELTAFLDWAHDQRQRMRSNRLIFSREIPGKVNVATMKRTPRVESNAASINDRMAALNAAIKAAIVLQTAPLSVEEVRAEVSRLRKSIPAIETYAS